jgi:hypothetical protein
MYRSDKLDFWSCNRTVMTALFAILLLLAVFWAGSLFLKHNNKS